MSKKVEKKEETTGDVVEEKKVTKKINDGKCCRCVFRKNKLCSCSKAKKYGMYTARKGGCNCFKYDD